MTWANSFLNANINFQFQSLAYGINLVTFLLLVPNDIVEAGG